jgi:hypothetical protein
MPDREGYTIRQLGKKNVIKSIGRITCTDTMIHILTHIPIAR